MGFEKPQILGKAWPGLGPAQKRQPCHFCHVAPGPNLTHTQSFSLVSQSLASLAEGRTPSNPDQTVQFSQSYPSSIKSIRRRIHPPSSPSAIESIPSDLSVESVFRQIHLVPPGQAIYDSMCSFCEHIKIYTTTIKHNKVNKSAQITINN